MKVLCIHFKGGVGKSTTAIHTTGVLLNEGGKNLLVDGDRQVTSYRFFNGGQNPASSDELIVTPQLSLIPLYTTEPISGHVLSTRLRKIEKIPHENIIVDTTPDPAVTNQIISEINPDLILIPIPNNDYGAHAQLHPLLNTILRMRALGITPRVKIIPLGGNEEAIRQIVTTIELDVEITNTVPYLPEVFGRAVYQEFQFAWNYSSYEYLYDLYRSIVLE